MSWDDRMDYRELWEADRSDRRFYQSRVKDLDSKISTMTADMEEVYLAMINGGMGEAVPLICKKILKAKEPVQ